MSRLFMFSLCYNSVMLKLHVIYNYKSIYPELSGKALTDALIRRCLEREDAMIHRSEKGKPFVSFPEADAGGPFVSVSHSMNTFALLVSDSDAGVDIQYARGTDTARIAARFFTEEEANEVAADDTGDRFYELWTRREAYSKYTGAGMEHVIKKEPMPADVRFADFRLEDGCFCAICMAAEEGDQSDEIQISYGE